MKINTKSSWIEKKPIYQIMVKDFAPSSWKQSKFAFIKTRISDIAKLNIGCVWLCGILSNYKGTTPFSILDPNKFEPSYGTEKELKELIDEVHNNGMRAITDFVPNHVSKNSPLCVDHPDWFIKGENGVLVTATDKRGAWSFKGTVQFDFLNPNVPEFLTKTGKNLFDFGFDGLRIDAPLGLLKARMIENWYPDRIDEVNKLYPEEFLKTFIDSIRQKYPEAGFLAEAFEEHAALWGCGADLVLDGGFIYSLFDTLKKRKSVSSFIEYINSQLSNPNLAATIHYKDGHDIRDVKFHDFGIERPRYLDAVESRLAASLMITMPGVPMFFNTEPEAVLDYAYHRHDSCGIYWDKYDKEMRSFYENLMKLAGHPVFRKGSFNYLSPLSNYNPFILAFSREYEDTKTVIAVNLYDQVEPVTGKSWTNLNVADLLKSVTTSQCAIKDMLTEKIIAYISRDNLEKMGLPVGLEQKQVQMLQIIPH